MIDTREDMLAEVRQTWLGRDLIEEGREEGRDQGRQRALLDAVVEALTVRFPEASSDRITSTAARLVAADTGHPVRAALALAQLDD